MKLVCFWIKYLLAKVEGTLTLIVIYKYVQKT